MTWNSGYVTDIIYTTGYYDQQAPSQIALSCLLGNVAPSFARRSEQLTYLELGCGRGRGALCLAASNPNGGWSPSTSCPRISRRRVNSRPGWDRQYRIHRSRFRHSRPARAARGRCRSAHGCGAGCRRCPRRHRAHPRQPSASGRRFPSELQLIAGMAGSHRAPAPDPHGGTAH